MVNRMQRNQKSRRPIDFMTFLGIVHSIGHGSMFLTHASMRCYVDSNLYPLTANFLRSGRSNIAFLKDIARVRLQDCGCVFEILPILKFATLSQLQLCEWTELCNPIDQISIMKLSS